MDIFALNATQEFGRKVAVALGVELAAHEEREFEDGEHKARPLVSVRGHNVYVIQSLHSGPEGSVNDRLCRLLFFISALKENGASRVTAVVPYLAYSRKDRQTKSRDPVTTRYIARLFEAAGVDLIMTLEAHNIVAYQNAFRCQTIHLDPRRLFAREAVRLDPEHPIGWIGLGITYAELGRFDEAIDAHKKLAGTIWSYFLGMTYAMAGLEDKAREVAAALEKVPGAALAPAWIYANLGEVEAAVQWLAHSEKERNAFYPWLLGNFHGSEFIADHPEVQARATALGLPDPRTMGCR